jgi:hypothetical protein
MGRKGIAITTIAIIAIISAFMLQAPEITNEPKYPGAPADSWCNSDYANRIDININNTGGPALTDYQIYMNLSTNPINETSLRVYNATSCVLRAHWCEDITSGNCTKLWINYSAVAASVWVNNTAIYYDNAAASSVSNGTNTFEFFDDFDGTSLDTGISENVAIENSIFVDNYSCHGNPKIYKKDSNEFWAAWHYNPNDFSGSTLPEGIAMKKIYINNLSTSNLTWVTNTSNDEELGLIDKFGTKYFGFYGKMAGLNTFPSTSCYRISAVDTPTWGSENTLENSDHRSDKSTIQINSTTYWLVYTIKSSGTFYLKYRVYDTGTETFGAAQTIRSGGSMYLLNAFYDSSTDKYFIYYHDYSPWKIYVVSKTGAGAWSSPTEIVSTGICYASPSVVKMDNGVFLLFYHDSNYDIKIMRGTDGINFTALKTLKSHATAQCMGSHVKVISSTHIALVYAWQVVQNSDHRIYFDILEYTAGSGGKWDKTGDPDSVTVADSIVTIYDNDDSWAGISSKSSYGVYDLAVRAKVKHVGDKSQFGMSNVFPDMFTNSDTITFLEYSNVFYHRTRNDGGNTDTLGTSELSNYHIDEARWKSGEVKFYRDDDATPKATHTTNIPDETMKVGMILRESGSDYISSDWVLVRKYASPEPSIILGSEEDAPAATNPIVIPVNKRGLFCNWTTDTTFANIALNLTNYTDFFYYNSTSQLWTFYNINRTINANTAIPKHAAVFVHFNATTTVECEVLVAETITIPANCWYYTCLRESTAKTIAEIIAALTADGCVIAGTNEVYAWNSTAGTYTNAGGYSVLPNEGFAIYATTGCSWDGGV